MKKNIRVTNFLGAVPQLLQLIDNHGVALTEKGLNPATLKEKLVNCCTVTQTGAQKQADARTALRNATAELNVALAERYVEFSSIVDLLRGAVGNRTALGQQMTSLRKEANRKAVRKAAPGVSVVKAA